ncbi:MAG: hypothetical protein R3E66_01325 [bacterium]
MSRLTLLTMLFFGLSTAGASCGEDGAAVQNGSFVPGTPNTLADLPDGTDSDTPVPAGNTTTTTTATPNGPRGTTEMGDQCQSSRQCVDGLGCEGGTCVEQGELRISMSWNTNTDADLHVRTPAGEEIYYRNRDAADGGQFQKDGCIASRCDASAPKIEAVIWRGEPTEGTYEFFGVNYDAVEAANLRFDVTYQGQTQTFNANVPKTAGATSPTFAVTIGNANGPGQLEFITPTEEQWVRGPTVNFSVNPHDDNIKSVRYSSGRYDLGESTSGGNFNHSYTFNNLGEHDIKARGFDASGMELDNDIVKMVVMDQRDGLPNPRNGAVVSDWLLAKRLLTHAGAVNLYNRQVSGRNDGADSLSNMRAMAQKGTAKNSCYGNAPCGRVKLDARMLQAMVILRQVNGYSFRVTSIAGGSHSAGSRHYRGVAFDVDTINGRSVSGNRTLARQFMQACRDLGATEVLGPGNRGHSGHVHCAW